MTKKQALLVLDFINDVVHPEGRYAVDGYYDQVQRRGVLERAATAVQRARDAGVPVVFVIVGFSSSYIECPDDSPVFAVARHERRIQLGSWGTEIHARLAPAPHEPVVAKNRINPFFATNLDLILRRLQVDSLVLSGVSTEFVVLSTAMAAHDRDYRVTVLEDACASSTDQLHEAALRIAARTATVARVDDVFPA